MSLKQRPISLAQTMRVNLISLVALATLSFGLSPAAWAQSNNTAFGTGALSSNTAGTANSAFGWDTLLLNTKGYANTATGFAALEDNNIGAGNTATGTNALANNGGGNQNVATGWNALLFNSGGDNTAIGAFALQENTSGSNNIAVGIEAGLNLVTGSNNIDIGNPGGGAGEANAIRIGTAGTQTATYIAGIFGSTATGGCSVVVEKTGQLGCVSSSARYKRDVQDMGNASDRLMRLRPVTFHYKADQTGALQYGLIAEEVEKVYPELAIHGADGEVETVAYQMLPAMLLNEVQNQARQLEQKDSQIARLERQLAAIQKKNAEIDALASRLDVLESQAHASEPGRLASASR
jgi:hypothetical protein